MNDILANLNEEQKAAVTHGEGPLMIIAGAGTGKTTVMTRRMGWLIAEGKARPDEILALTFTDKAAAEMEERVDRLLPYGYVDLWISTFHAFCQRVLEAHGLDIGLPHRPRVLTDVDAWVMLREELDRLPLNYYKPLGNPTKFLHAFLAHVSRLKDEGLTPEAYRNWIDEHKVDDTEEQRRCGELADTYAIYEQILLERGAIDFGGLIMATLRLFRERSNILASYQRQFKAMMVDEFQDTNRAQYDLIKLLAGERGNVAVVGDDDQGIYRFRGASVENILRFNREYPHARRIVLTKNYRSVQPVLDAAYGFIARNNPHRLEVALQESHGLSKQLESQCGGEGGVEHLHAATVDDEASMVADKILDLKKTTGCDWKDIAILARANDHAEPFLVSLTAAGIPFRFLAMSGLYRQPIILDAIALLHLIDRPGDSPSAFRTLSHPTLGIAPNDLAALSHAAHKHGLSLLRASDAPDVTVSADAVRRVHGLSSLFDELRGEAARRNVLEVFARVVNVSGLHAAVLQQDEGEQARLFSLLNQFVERLRRFIQTARHPDVHAFLLALEEEEQAGEEGALSTDDQASPDEVQVMTMHGAKGLEFRFVFMVNMVDRRFPSARRGDPIPLPEGLIEGDADSDHLAEERRLCYVGLTRARERVFFTSADSYGGARKKKPSLFLSELGFDAPAPFTPSTEPLYLAQRPIDHLVGNMATIDPPAQFSFTQLTAYDHCPLQYKFAHVYKIPVFGSGSQSFGKTIHATLQRFFEEWLVATPVSVDRLLELYRASWIDEWYGTPERKEAYRVRGEEMLRAFHDDLRVHPPRPLFLERGFTVKVGDMVIKGRVDRIDAFEDGVEIIDYKTGAPKTQKTLTTTDKTQMLLYALAARDVFELLPKRLTFHYLMDGSRVSFEPKEKDFERLQDRLRETIGAIRAQAFDPTPGPACRSCDFRSICPFRAL